MFQGSMFQGLVCQEERHCDSRTWLRVLGSSTGNTNDVLLMCC